MTGLRFSSEFFSSIGNHGLINIQILKPILLHFKLGLRKYLPKQDPDPDTDPKPTDKKDPDPNHKKNHYGSTPLDSTVQMLFSILVQKSTKNYTIRTLALWPRCRQMSNFKKCAWFIDLIAAMLWTRIHWIRIRHFNWIRIRVRIQFRIHWWPKIEEKKTVEFFFLFLIKKCNFLDLHKEPPSYRRSLQPSKENSTMNQLRRNLPEGTTGFHTLIVAEERFVRLSFKLHPLEQKTNVKIRLFFLTWIRNFSAESGSTKSAIWCIFQVHGSGYGTFWITSLDPSTYSGVVNLFGLG